MRGLTAPSAVTLVAIAAVLACPPISGHASEVRANHKTKSHCGQTGPLAYVANSPGNTAGVDVYSQQGSTFTLCYNIPLPNYYFGPLYVDQQQNLWIVDGPILGFARGATSPSRTLSATAPIDMVVDSDGTIYVAQGSNQSIAVYAPGSNTQTSSIYVAGYPDSIAIDNQHDLYVEIYYNLTEVDLSTGQLMNLGAVPRFGTMQTTAGGALAGCYYPGTCGLLSSGSGPGKLATWRPVFQSDYVTDIRLFPGEQAAITNLQALEAGVWRWPGPDGGQFIVLGQNDGSVSGTAVSPADPLGSPFHSFARSAHKRLRP